AYFAGAALIAVPFCALNVSLYASLLPPYFSPERLEGHEHFVEALAGNLVSPARGLFVFSPMLAFAFSRRRLERLDVLFLVILVAHWLAISSFPHWWGGHSVGPRFFTDVLPYLAWFLTAPIERLVERPRQQPVWAAAFAACLLISVAIHTR